MTQQTAGDLPGETGGHNPTGPTQPQPPGIGAAVGAGRSGPILGADTDHVQKATGAVSALWERERRSRLSDENTRSLQRGDQSRNSVSKG